MYIKTVTVGSKKYNIAQANALEQKRLLSIVGAKIAMNFASSGKIKTINTDFLLGNLISLPEPIIDDIAAIVLYKTIENGGSALVTVDDFQGNITEYYLLIAEAIGVNLNDFFTYLAKSKTSGQETQSEAQ